MSYFGVKKIGLMALAALATLGWSGAASAFTLHDHFQVKVGVTSVNPDVSADVSPIGGGVDISDETVPTASLEWYFNPHVSAELICCVTTHDVASTLGIPLGSVSLFPPTVTLKYHWNVEGALQPYVGVGVNYTHFFNEDASSSISNISYDDSFGPAVQVGADYRLGDHWLVSLDVKKIWISSDVSINSGAINANVDIDPVLVTAAVGYRF